MKFPVNSWHEMEPDEQKYFSDMSEEELRSRWDTVQGKEIKQKIIEINLSYGKSKDYSSFIGTVKTSLCKTPPKIDLRGIDFSNYSNLKNNEYFGFDFSNCSLIYSDFSGSIFTGSHFNKSDILYSNFSHAHLEDCNFSNSNLTLSNFNFAYLEYADLRGSWITDISLRNSNLGYVKFNNKTDFQNIDISKTRGSSNPLFISFIRRNHYLKHFKDKSIGNKIIYYLWLAISDCGQSFLRWTTVSLVLCGLFGFIYSIFPDYFTISNHRPPTGFTFYYYSAVTFTTLGFGDIIPNNVISEILVTIEVVIGYIMLGGLISIFATKFIPKD